MAKADASSLKRSPSTSKRRIRGPYKHPCNVCRSKKRGCDEQRPTCGPCINDGRQDECSWDKDKVAHKPRAEAHFEALNKRIFALRDYAKRLEQFLEIREREHGGTRDSNGLSFRDLVESRPLDMDHVVIESNDSESMEDDVTYYDPVDELCISTQNLKFSGDSTLIYHGPTAVFTYASTGDDPRASSRFPGIAENPDATYVLITEGVDENHYNPHFDWSRHLPPSVPLDRREHDKLLSLTFSFFTSWCFRIVPALFLRDMYRSLSGPRSDVPPKTAHYSPMLHNALVALGSCFSNDPRICDIKSRQYFADEAKKYIEEECRRPTLSGIHALSTLASFYSSQGDQALGYLYFGMSARLSQSLGLSMDCSAWVNSGLITEDDRMDRNWAYWTTFSQDVCWSLYVGRDFGVPFPSGVAHIPVPFVDSEFDQMPWRHPQGKIPDQPNLLSKTFAATCGLLMIARRIMDLVNGLSSGKKRHVPYDNLVSDIVLALNTWRGNLSPDVDLTPKIRSTATPHRLMLHLCYWWLTILIHRPFYHRTAKQIHSSDKEIDHVKHCKRAAQNIVELTEAWRELYTLRYVPVTFIQAIFSAGTVYLLQAVQATQGIRIAEKELTQGREHATRCIHYLLEVGKSFQAATNVAEILKNLIHKQANPRIIPNPSISEMPTLQFHSADEVSREKFHSRRKTKASGAKESSKDRGSNNANDFVLPAEGSSHSQDSTSSFQHSDAGAFFSPPAMSQQPSSSSSSSFYPSSSHSSIQSPFSPYPSSPIETGINPVHPVSAPSPFQPPYLQSMFPQGQQAPAQAQFLLPPGNMHHYNSYAPSGTMRNCNTARELSGVRSLIEGDFSKGPYVPPQASSMGDSDDPQYLMGLNMSSSFNMDYSDMYMDVVDGPEQNGGVSWSYAPQESSSGLSLEDAVNDLFE